MIDMNVFDSVREDIDLEALLIDAKGFAQGLHPVRVDSQQLLCIGVCQTLHPLQASLQPACISQSVIPSVRLSISLVHSGLTRTPQR